MVVRNTERVEMAGGSVKRGAQRRPAGRGWRGIAGAVLGALAMAATVGQAVGQGGEQIPKELFPGGKEQQPWTEPLAVAYLAAPYSGAPSGTPTGLAATFRLGAKSPGTSLSAKLTKLDGEPWQGYRVELFKGSSGKPSEQLSYDGRLLGLGGSKHLLPSLYIFVPESRPVRISKLWAYDSDAWHEKPDHFSVLLDTSFHLEGIPKKLGPGGSLFDGPLPEGLRGEIIACANKRSRSAPVCDGKSGAVIEDPLSGLPSLLMEARGGPPEWLKEVPTEICVDRQKGHVVRVPESSQAIPLDQAEGDRWCSAILKLNYVALREEGLRIGSLGGKKQLSSRFASDNDWRMWAERPKAIKVRGRDAWVQRIVLQPPRSAETSGKITPKVSSQPAPVIPSTFEILIGGQLTAASIKQLWYRPSPGGVDGDVECEIPAFSQATGKWGSSDLFAAAALRSKTQDRLVATEPDNQRLMSWGQPLALIAEAGGQAYCGLATPVPSLERQFNVKLQLPKGEKTTSRKGSTKEKLVAPSAQPLPTDAERPGTPVKVVFSSANRSHQDLMDQLSHASKIENEQGVFEGVDSNKLRFALKPGSSHRISKCDVDRQPQLQCGPDPEGQSLKIAPKQRGAMVPKLIRVTVTIAPRDVNLVFQADGPGGVRIQMLSDGKLTPLFVLGGNSGPSSREEAVAWKSGDKIKVNLVDQDLHKVAAATLENRPIVLQSDREFEISLKPDLHGQGLSITTKERLFSGTLSVTARGGDIVVWHENEKLGSVGVGVKKDYEVKSVKHKDKLSIQVADPDLEVAKLSLSDGQNVTVLDEAVLNKQRPSFSLDRNHLRSSEKGDTLAALHLEAELKIIDVPLPTEVLLKPAVRLGKRLLPLQSCKVTLAEADATFTHKRDGTLATFGKDKRAPKSGSYVVEVAQGPDAPRVCRGLVAEARVVASKLNELGPDRTLSIPLKRPKSRAFVGVVSLSKELRSKQKNWKAALAALQDAFDAGVKEGKYIWGAIYGPDGKALTRSETADEAPLEIESAILESAATMERLKDGARLVPFDTLVDLAAKDVADFEGNVDALIVAETVRTTCGWSSPPHAQGSHAALVRIASFSGKQGTKLIEGVRRCDKTERSEKAGVVVEVEVVPEDSDTATGATPDMQLRRAIAEAAKGFKAKSSQ